MNTKQLEAFAKEVAKSIKSESDLNDFRRMLSKVVIGIALNGELEEHLGYEKHSRSLPWRIQIQHWLLEKYTTHVSARVLSDFFSSLEIVAAETVSTTSSSISLSASSFIVQ